MQVGNAQPLTTFVLRLQVGHPRIRALQNTYKWDPQKRLATRGCTGLVEFESVRLLQSLVSRRHSRDRRIRASCQPGSYLQHLVAEELELFRNLGFYEDERS